MWVAQSLTALLTWDRIARLPSKGLLTLLVSLSAVKVPATPIWMATQETLPTAAQAPTTPRPPVLVPVSSSIATSKETAPTHTPMPLTSRVVLPSGPAIPA